MLLSFVEGFAGVALVLPVGEAAKDVRTAGATEVLAGDLEYDGGIVDDEGGLLGLVAQLHDGKVKLGPG